MSDREPDRPAQVVLDDAICDAITHAMREWNLTAYEVVGVLTIVAARYAHTSISHDDV